jgi:hypothetical protein
LVLGYPCGALLRIQAAALLLTFNYQEKEPMKFNIAQKPAEINCMAHGMRGTTRSSQMAKAGANHSM